MDINSIHGRALFKFNEVHVNESNRYALHLLHYQLISISEREQERVWHPH